MYCRTAIISVVCALVQISFCQTATTRRIGPSAIPVEQQLYGFQASTRCRIFSHQSAILKNKDHHVLIFDGGIAKFRYQINGEPVEVLDLNGHTGWIDLSQPFFTNNIPLQTYKRLKADNVPVMSRFGLWSDGAQDCIYINGGHFFDADKFNQSQYFLTKEQLPPYNVWRFCVGSKTWTKVYEDTTTNRTLGGSFASVPGTDLSYYLGGLRAPRSARDTPLDKSISSPAMLVYNHRSNTLSSEKYFAPDDQYGYWHGQMKHLPIGGGKGFLISLLAERSNLNTYIKDEPYIADEKGEEVSFTKVLIYDIEAKVWYNQSTSFINEKPESRTRFCMELVHGEKYNTWDLWVFGGQRLLDDSIPTDEIWVLSMPSFIWTKVAIPAIGPGVTTRSPTCNVVGSQLMIFGGYPPGVGVAENATCDTEYLKIFDMSDPGWRSSYKLNTVYQTPDQVVQHTELATAERRKPYQNSWSSPKLQAAFDMPLNSSSNGTITPKKTSGKRFGPGAIAACVVAPLVGIAIIIALVWIGRNRHDRQPGASKVKSSGLFGSKITNIFKSRQSKPTSSQTSDAAPDEVGYNEPPGSRGRNVG